MSSIEFDRVRISLFDHLVPVLDSGVQRRHGFVQIPPEGSGQGRILQANLLNLGLPCWQSIFILLAFSATFAVSAAS